MKQRSKEIESKLECDSMEVGIDSFAAAFDDASLAVNPSERLQDLVKQIERADQVGLDVFGVGEHHRREFLDSAPAVILGAAAARTQRIRLTSAVTVLSAADPVRVFQEFATLDLLSHGRAEMVAGRGSSIEAFPLFGLRLEDYDSLFAEKLPKASAETFADMGGRWRDSTIIRSNRSAWTPLNGRNHRRRNASLQAN